MAIWKQVIAWCTSSSASVKSSFIRSHTKVEISPRGAPLLVSAVISDTCRPSSLTTALDANPSSCAFDSAFLISSPRKRLSVEFRCVKYRKGGATEKIDAGAGLFVRIRRQNSCAMSICVLSTSSPIFARFCEGRQTDPLDSARLTVPEKETCGAW